MGGADKALAVDRETAEWLEWHGGAPGAEVHADPDVTWLVKRGTAWGNAAARIRLTADSMMPRLDSIVERYRVAGRGAGFWVSPFATPPQIRGALRERGFRCRKHFPGMYCELAGARVLRAPGNVEIRTVEDCSMFARSRHGHRYFGKITTPIRRYELNLMIHMANRTPRRVWQFAAWVDGEPIGASMLFLGDAAAGIHDVGVVREFRNRGIGSALVSHACASARDLGARGAVLIASGAGEGAYRHAGFVEVCQMSYW